jgi:hypothetical protein
MSWFVKSPFAPEEDPVGHMMDLINAEAEKAGQPLTQSDLDILSKEHSDLDPIPDDLQQRVRKLIIRVLDEEPWDEFEREVKSFGSSMEWARRWHGAKSSNPNILIFAEQVYWGARYKPAPNPLKGWALVGDRILVVLCALVLVLSVGIIGGILFGGK